MVELSLDEHDAALRGGGRWGWGGGTGRSGARVGLGGHHGGVIHRELVHGELVWAGGGGGGAERALAGGGEGQFGLQGAERITKRG